MTEYSFQMGSDTTSDISFISIMFRLASKTGVTLRVTPTSRVVKLRGTTATSRTISAPLVTKTQRMSTSVGYTNSVTTLTFASVPDRVVIFGAEIRSALPERSRHEMMVGM